MLVFKFTNWNIIKNDVILTTSVSKKYSFAHRMLHTNMLSGIQKHWISYVKLNVTHNKYYFCYNSQITPWVCFERILFWTLWQSLVGKDGLTVVWCRLAFNTNSVFYCQFAFFFFSCVRHIICNTYSLQN